MLTAVQAYANRPTPPSTPPAPRDEVKESFIKHADKVGWSTKEIDFTYKDMLAAYRAGKESK